MSDFDTQLAGRLQRLTAAAPSTPFPKESPGSGRRFNTIAGVALVAAAVVVAAVIVGPRLSSPPLATITVGRLHILAESGAAWEGSVDQEGAEATALAKIREFDPSVEDLRVVSVDQVAAVHTVTGPSGRVLDTSDPIDAWVFLVAGTSDEWANTSGWALVDAESGDIIHADLLHTNDPAVP
jgi:hypothetical protein